MTAPTLDSLARFIRFQLSELVSRNAHHEFEHLVRHFARLRITERVIPATGPVGAGGDGGRDFETYRTYLSSTPIANSTFLARAKDKNIVFACSLKTNIEGKIKSDLKTICASDHNISDVYYFCEANIPIGKQIKLKKHAKEEHSVDLTIFDGQALSENLTGSDVFWLAEQYLAVPSEMYPKTIGSSRYQASREKWIAENQPPVSFADFTEIKASLRRSTFEQEHRTDLLSWIRTINKFREDSSSPVLRRRATYEICVAALRGLNDLSSHRALVNEYFADVGRHLSIADLTDAVTLLSYCSSAVVLGHFDEDGQVVHLRTLSLLRLLDAELKTSSGNRKCELLQIRGQAEGLQFRLGPTAQLDSGGMFAFWGRMLRLVPNSPLFPIERFADLLTALAPAFAGNKRYDAITRKTDELVGKRASSHTAAEKCRDRAVALLQAGKTLLAIKQLHISKVKWFTAETLRGSLLSMLTLSDAYASLGLVFAAKYYATATGVMAFRSSDERTRDLFASAMRRLFNVCYLGGEWFTCLNLASMVFNAHNAFDRDAYDYEKHDDLAAVVSHLAIVRHVISSFAPSLVPEAQRHIDRLPVHPVVRKELDDLVDSVKESWSILSEERIYTTAQEELWARPLGDLGRERVVEWRALGIHWIASFSNDYETTALAEELLATLQIMLADLATTDLVLLPTTVRLTIHLTPQDRLVTEEPPGNDEAHWRIGLPRSWLATDRTGSAAIEAIHALAASILGVCSTLAGNEYESRLSAAVLDGLFDKTNVVASYATLYRDLISAGEFDRPTRERFDPLFARRDFAVQEAEALAWPTTDGPGYSLELSLKMIRNRYRRAILPIRFTLPRILKDPGIREKLSEMQTKGMKDWELLQIVANRAIGYRVDQLKVSSPQEAKERADELWKKEELETDSPVPNEQFSGEHIDNQAAVSAAAIGMTWGLRVHRQTPDLSAMRRLLVARYHIERDDVPHESMF